MQRQLLAIAGWPDCRAQYEKNLADARGMANYYAMLLKQPERRHQGTGSDELSLRRNLRDAPGGGAVSYRQWLLRDLEQVQAKHRPATADYLKLRGMCTHGGC